MIRSLATAATSSRGGSKNRSRIRGARCKSSSRKLDVTPSRLATSSSPDQRDMTAARIRPQIQQCRAQPVKCLRILSAILSQAIAASDASSAASANPFAILLVALWRGSKRSIGCARCSPRSQSDRGLLPRERGLAPLRLPNLSTSRRSRAGCARHPGNLRPESRRGVKPRRFSNSRWSYNKTNA